MPSSMSVKKTNRLLAAHNIFVLVTQNEPSCATNSLFSWLKACPIAVDEETQRGEPALAFIMNRRPDKICRVLVHSGIANSIVPKF